MSNTEGGNSANSNKLKGLRRKQKSYIFTVLTNFLVFASLVFISVVSFKQTQIAFSGADDPNLNMFGLDMGMWISYAFAIAFQYGQNVILFIRKEYLSKKVFRMPILRIKTNGKQLALFAFLLFAFVDAGSNVLWYKGVFTASDDAVRDMVIQIVMYTALILSVFSEEAMEWVWGALENAWRKLIWVNSEIDKEEDKLSKTNKTQNTSKKREANKSSNPNGDKRTKSGESNKITYRIPPKRYDNKKPPSYSRQEKDKSRWKSPLENIDGVLDLEPYYSMRGGDTPRYSTHK